MKSLKIIILAILPLLASFSCPADRVVLKNGRTIRGRIVETLEDRLSLETETGRFTIYLRDIEKRIDSRAGENDLVEAEIALGGKDAATALAFYRKAMDHGLEGEIVREHLLGRKHSFESALHLADEDARRKFGSELAMLVTKMRGRQVAADSVTTGTEEFYITVAGYLEQANRRKEAAALFQSIPAGYYETHPPAREYAMEFLKSEILRRSSQGDFDSAMRILENLEDLDFREGHSNQILLYLRWGARLREQKQWEEAADLYAGKLAEVSFEIAANRFELLLDRMETLADGGTDLSRLVLLTRKHASLLAPTDLRNRLGRYLISLGQTALEHNRFKDAREFFHSSFDITGREDPSLLSVCDYREKALGLDPGDLPGHYRMGLFCIEKGLLGEAEGHFRIAAGDEKLKSSSLSEIELIRAREKIEILNKALECYDRSLYVEAMDALQPLLKDETTTAGRSEASALAALCTRQLRQASKKRPLKAMIYLQQAERHYMLEEYDAALLKLELVLEQYSDTQVAPEAREKMIDILRQRELASLEKPKGEKGRTGVVPRIVPKDNSRLNDQINALLDTIREE